MMIAGFEMPTAGDIAIDGQSVVAMPPYRRNIGMVFQNYALFPHLTVEDNIGFPLKQRGVPKAERARLVNEALELVQLPGYGGRYPRQLSGGQQQRVALARAIVFKPRLLLMDEPLGALDKQLRENLQLEIKRLHQRLGITFIYVTHDQREALVMSDRVSVMNHGRIEQIAAPQVLYDTPSNRFVATFVGEANFLTITPAGPGDPGMLTVRTTDGATLHAPAHDYRPGCLCMVRPEKMTVTPAGGGASGENVLAATVREVVFMGEMTRYLVETAAHEPLVIKQTNRAGDVVLAPGDPATVAWAVADTRLVS
jgi:ABC-type Fe3+/spermidine/putrescine transport system ATPase subunit